MGLRLALVAGLVLAGGLAACTSGGLEGLSASVYQTRMDVAVRQVEVRLVNGTGQDLTVRHLALDSTSFTPTMDYPRADSLVTAGRTVDLPVALSTAACGGGERRHTVRVDYRLGDGRQGSVEVDAADEGGRIEQLREAECFAADVAAVAGLEIVDAPRVRDLGEQLVAEVDVQVTPREAGELEIRRAGSTTLLQQVDPVSGERLVDGWEPGLVVTGPTDLTLTLVPGRCDAHAVAEDKQGTMFPLDVVLDGREGQVVVVSPPEVTGELYAFVQEACG